MIRVRLIDNYGVVLNGDDSGRDEILAILNSGPKHIDELYSGGWSNITYFDVEQRRLDVAAELLDVSIPLMHEHDLPICRVWQMGSRARLQLMVGEWDDAAAEAELCSRFAPRIRLYGLRHLRSAAAAADLVQDVLLMTLQKLRAGAVREPDRLASFILGTCRQVVVDGRRSGMRRERILEHEAGLLARRLDPFGEPFA